MKVLANRYLYMFRELLPESVELDLFDPEDVPQNVSDYDALFVNTTTEVNAKSLPETGKLSFIATGSSGNDHIDLDYLESKNIRFADAAGCNAKAVAEYVLTSLLFFQQETKIPFNELKVGLIGKGHVGTDVSRLFDRFSIPYVSYDPPKANLEFDFTSAHFEELKECNVLSFHTPITHTGDYPTYQLLNKTWFRGANYHLLINTSRGSVIDEKLVLEELKNGRLKNAVIDVWKDEPDFNPQLASKILFATPHIAGYSIQSKIRATKMIIDPFCEHFGLPKPYPWAEEIKFIDLKEENTSLDEVLQTLHPIRTYDESLRKLAACSEVDRAKEFALLRSETPLRHEFANLQIDPVFLERFPELGLLGIQSK